MAFAPVHVVASGLELASRQLEAARGDGSWRRGERRNDTRDVLLAQRAPRRAGEPYGPGPMPKRMPGALVTAWLGLPGAGKTYGMVWEAYKLRQRAPFMRVWANFPLTLPGDPVLPLETLDEWEACRYGLVLLDEAHVFLDARGALEKQRPRTQAKLGQLRKARIWVFFTTHSADKVDKRLRGLTEEVRFMSSYRQLGWFTEIRRAGFTAKDANLGAGIVRVRSEIDRAYDTLGALHASDELG